MPKIDPIIAFICMVPTCLCTLSFADEEAITPRAIPVDERFGDMIISNSGQFRIRGGESSLRGSVAMLAEQIRDEFLQLIEEPNAEVKIPIHVQLVGHHTDKPSNHPIATSITFDDGGYQLRLTVHAFRGLDLDLFQNALTAALVYVRSLSERSTEDTETALLVQPWLVEGLREAKRWQSDASDRRLYEAMFQSGGVFKLDELFSMNAESHRVIDATSRAAFTVSSGALVMALLEQPEGKQAFRNFLKEVALFSGEMPTLLRRHFPELNLSENSMEKWWRLLLAHKGTARLTDSLSIFETEKTLNEGLQLFFRDEDGNMREEPFDSWQELMKLDPLERANAIRITADALVRLSYRCFPSYRPLIASYQEILTLIPQEKPRLDHIAKQLDDLAITRQTIIAKAQRSRDYLDWFEITRARETSGAFDDYLRLQRQLRSPTTTTRNDPVSNTLDRFDAIFYRKMSERPNAHPLDW